MWLFTAEELVAIFDTSAMRDNAHYGLNKCTLATAVGAYDSDKVIGIYLQVDVLEGNRAIVTNAEVVDSDYGLSTHLGGILRRLHVQSPRGYPQPKDWSRQPLHRTPRRWHVPYLGYTAVG